VLAARDGEEALLAVGSQNGRIDLLVTDVVLPRMDGVELAMRLRTSHPELQVLFTSGYSERTPEAGGINFLPKPYTPSELARRIQELLGGPASQGAGSKPT
jgi:two-component system cell cycle sensor histidine kinase/response regulator CckA